MHTIGAAHPGWRKQQRNVQSQIAPGLPPQLNPGEYKQLVRKSLDRSVNVRRAPVVWFDIEHASP